MAVTPVAPSRVFHPKVWALRFSSAGLPVRYRLLVLSRNLTFARSWDTVLVLDGELLDRANAIKANHPLGDFFAHLPMRSVRGVAEPVRARIERLQTEIRRVRFELPDDIDEISFHPQGIPGIRDSTFDQRTDRIVVVSPFLSAPMLSELSREGRKNVLISRLDELSKLNAKQLSGFHEIYSMDPDATVDPEKLADASMDPFGEGSGLHAKLYVADDGWNAHVWTGSANATSAAFNGNIELLVRMRGRKSKFGAEALFERKEGVTSFRDLLIPFTPSADGVPEDPVSVALDERLEQARTIIGSRQWTASVTPATSAGGFNARLHAADWSADTVAGVTMTVYPITLNPSRAVSVYTDGTAIFTGLSTEALTAFFAFEVTVSEAGRTQSCDFTINAHLEG
ncbi:MAG: phospholipase D family protein, partial [bacterium]